MRHALLIFLLLVIATNAYAKIYTCKVNGKIVYSDAPCPSGATRLQVTKDELFQEKLEWICLKINSYTSPKYIIESCINEQNEAKKYIDELEEKKYVETCKADYHQNYIAIKYCIDKEIFSEKFIKKYEEEKKERKIEAQKRLDLIAKAKRLRACYVEYVIVDVDRKGIHASLTYTNSDGGTEQHDKYISMSHTITFITPCNTHPYISAQKADEYGTIEVQILINGKVRKSSKSSSPYGIASVGL